MELLAGGAAQTVGADTAQFVCVSHKPEMVERYIGSNSNINTHPVTVYDNRVNNIGIPHRYNHFIDHAMGDGWVVFLHHDMEFDEDPVPLLRQAPKDSIYGVIGVKVGQGRRFVHVGRRGKRGIGVERGRHTHLNLWGRIKCDKSISPTGAIGAHARGLPVVDTVDCCCVIVHSSLVRKHGLRFDPRFAWHFYSEDFSLNALTRHGIATRVLQVDCGHYGLADLDDEFHASRGDLLAKYAGTTFGSTCYVPPIAGIERFAGRGGLLLQY